MSDSKLKRKFDFRSSLIPGAIGWMFICIYFGIVISRINYPYSLEWVEDGMVETAIRLADGQSIYSEPSLEYTGFIYPPLYFYLSALMSFFLGPGYLAARLVSVLASIGILSGIFFLVRRETGCGLAGWVAAGMFCAGYRLTGAWLDIARVDSLFLALLIWSAYFCRRSGRWSHQVASVVLLIFAALAKQSAIPIGVSLCLYAGFRLRSASRWILPVFAPLSIALVYIWLNIATGGWFWFYVYYVPSHHAPDNSMWLGFWLEHMVWLIPLLCLSAYSFYTAWKLKNIDFIVFHALFAGLSIVMAWLTLLHSGGYNNALLPPMAALCISASFGLAHGKQELKGLITLCFLLQFGLLTYNPLDQIPTAADRAAYDHLLESVRDIDGQVYIPSHSYLEVLPQKAPYAHVAAVADVLRVKHDGQSGNMVKEFIDAIDDRKWAAIVWDPNFYAFEKIIKRQYRPAFRAFANEATGWPVTGMKTRPEIIYLPQ